MGLVVTWDEYKASDKKKNDLIPREVLELFSGRKGKAKDVTPKAGAVSQMRYAHLEVDLSDLTETKVRSALKALKLFSENLQVQGEGEDSEKWRIVLLSLPYTVLRGYSPTVRLKTANQQEAEPETANQEAFDTFTKSLQELKGQRFFYSTTISSLERQFAHNSDEEIIQRAISDDRGATFFRKGCVPNRGIRLRVRFKMSHPLRII